MCNPTTGKPIFKTGEERLSDLILQELGIDLPPSAVRIFVRAHWDALASAAHEIHSIKHERRGQSLPNKPQQA